MVHIFDFKVYLIKLQRMCDTTIQKHCSYHHMESLKVSLVKE